MGVKHVATGANFSKYAAFANYPLLDGFGLTDLAYLGGNEASSKVNHAPSGANFTLSGAPTYNTRSVTCDSATAFVTSTLDTVNDTTLAGVFVPVASSSGGSIVSNFITGLTNAFGLWTANTTALNLAGGGSIDNTTSPLLSTTRLHFAAARFVGTEKAIVVGIEGELVFVTETFTRVRHATEPFRIAGDNYAGGVNSSITVAAAAIHKAGLDTEALQAMYDYFRWYYGQFDMDVA